MNKAEGITDQQRIEILEIMLKGADNGKAYCKLNEKTGFSLRQSKHDDAKPTVRKAIDDFIERNKLILP